MSNRQRLHSQLAIAAIIITTTISRTRHPRDTQRELKAPCFGRNWQPHVQQPAQTRGHIAPRRVPRRDRRKHDGVGASLCPPVSLTAPGSLEFTRRVPWNWQCWASIFHGSSSLAALGFADGLQPRWAKLAWASPQPPISPNLAGEIELFGCHSARVTPFSCL